MAAGEKKREGALAVCRPGEGLAKDALGGVPPLLDGMGFRGDPGFGNYDGGGDAIHVCAGDTDEFPIVREETHVGLLLAFHLDEDRAEEQG